MPRPLLLLDVDGVLNPYGAPRCPVGFTEYAMFPGEEAIRLCRMHGDWITELGQVFDVAWATSWNDEANRLVAPILGIAPLPVVAMPTAPSRPGAKLSPIARFVGRRPAVWIDDEHTPEAWDWSGARHDPTLLIAIAPEVGLTQDSVREALDWAERI
jgi:hypothetical protein